MHIIHRDEPSIIHVHVHTHSARKMITLKMNKQCIGITLHHHEEEVLGWNYTAVTLKDKRFSEISQV